jgi:23S rRNA (cytosine1962-C5)-methyltransferase
MSPANSDLTPEVMQQVISAAALRAPLWRTNPQGAFRLFAGFYEGFPSLVVDGYADTLLLFDYSERGDINLASLEQLADLICAHIRPFQSAFVKRRNHSDQALRRGKPLFGDSHTTTIEEHGIRYRIDVTMNQDAGFYLDTRHLRAWLKENCAGKSVLNTFAYTGSLGLAAVAGGASRVVQTDRNRAFLNAAKTSYSLNGFPINKAYFITGDFFRVISELKSQPLFNCVILDPPIFSQTSGGIVNTLDEYHRLVNKIRPLAAHQGHLVLINNAVFLSGSDFIKTIEDICADGYLSLQTTISIPEDITGYAQIVRTAPPVDPAPFNHSTKIAILTVERKDQRTA